MSSSVNFWTPVTVIDSGSGYDPIDRSGISQKFIRFGKWADEIAYFGKRKVEIKYKENPPDSDDHCSHYSSLRGRAKKLIFTPEMSIQESISQDSNCYQVALKIIACLTLLPFLLVTKACYKYFYVQTFLDAGHPSDDTLEDLLEKYPHDSDLKSLELCQQHRLLKQEMKEKEEEEEFSYQKFKDLIQNIQNLLKQHPEHKHAKDLLNHILGIPLKKNSTDKDWKEISDNISGTPLLNIQNDDEWFDLFELLLTLPGNHYPESLSVLFKMLETNEDKANFKVLVNNYTKYLAYGSKYSYLDAGNFYLAMISKLLNVSDKQYLDLLNWILDKEMAANQKAHYISKNAYTCLSLFYYQCLPLFQRPYPQEVADLEKRMINFDNGFTQEFNERRLLAVLFGLNGTTSIDSVSFELRGFIQQTGDLKTNQSETHVNSQLNEYVYPILGDTLNKLMQNPNYANHLIQLNQVLSEDVLEDFEAQLCVNGTGDHRAHAWSQVRYKDYLLIGNQGYGCGNFSGVLVLKINSKEFNPKNSCKLKLSLNSQPTSSFFREGPNQEFLKQEYFDKLDPQFVGYLSLPKQKAGNCPWKAIKLNLISSLFILNTFDELESGKSFTDIEKKLKPLCNHLKKELTHPVREKILENYLIRHTDDSCPQKPDEALLDRIYEKAKRKNWLTIQTMLQNRS